MEQEENTCTGGRGGPRKVYLLWACSDFLCTWGFLRREVKELLLTEFAGPVAVYIILDVTSH